MSSHYAAPEQPDGDLQTYMALLYRRNFSPTNITLIHQAVTSCRGGSIRGGRDTVVVV